MVRLSPLPRWERARVRGNILCPPLSEPEALPPGQKPLWGGA